MVTRKSKQSSIVPDAAPQPVAENPPSVETEQSKNDLSREMIKNHLVELISNNLLVCAEYLEHPTNKKQVKLIIDLELK